MPTIILKKTFKIKPAGFKVANEKSFSFHGGAVTNHIVNTVNQRLATVRYNPGASRVQFGGGPSGHFQAPMNHDCQKFNEEDVICAILDAMEDLGWNFRFQYDSESQSVKLNGSSMTFRELFIFQKAGGDAGAPAGGGAMGGGAPAPAPGATILRIAAPVDVAEGQTFTAEYKGRRFQVAAPPGGLRKGQVTEVPEPF
eukprot:CAMPEP_0198126474 /NCGR_PEP_ID=MMETSP1442-20131203/44893_1 /TAXON_ID= /ORGANISM="Craspedostauros australis, Strain CCMP3328" /LENGTH=197 /DNA_ID=CAMNT_0043786261 /DNA_START=67 /DNA_END=660 /DNA_ORIENTATION=+